MLSQLQTEGSWAKQFAEAPSSFGVFACSISPDSWGTWSWVHLQRALSSASPMLDWTGGISRTPLVVCSIHQLWPLGPRCHPGQEASTRLPGLPLARSCGALLSSLIASLLAAAWLGVLSLDQKTRFFFLAFFSAECWECECNDFVFKLHPLITVQRLNHSD